MASVPQIRSRSRGELRIYLGAAPGVGKTYAMLCEAHRRRERGTDVVVGCVEHHERPCTAALLDGLEEVPLAPFGGHGPAGQGTAGSDGVAGELDVEAVLERVPAVVLVDDLAHTNAPGAPREKRWQDVEVLLGAGIDVISTVNIQHLESLVGVVESITGTRQQETVPDEFVRCAEQIELVDMTPQALRRRLAHGNVYSSDKIDAALSHYFRVGNLTALRELALLWTADRVDEYLQKYRSEHRISAPWQARERIVVALSGGPEGRTLLRRAARMAAKGAGGQLLAVSVVPADGLRPAAARELAVQRTLVEDLGGTYHQVSGDEIPVALLDFARGVNATQIVLGSSRRKPWQYVFGPGVGALVASEAGPDLDVHIVTHRETARGPGLPVARGAARLSRARVVSGWLAATLGPLLLGVLMNSVDPRLGFANDVLLFLVVTVAAGLVGGLLPALVSAALCSLLLNYFFTVPTHTWSVASPRSVVSLTIFFGVAVAVASVVDLAARRTEQAQRLRAESEILSVLAGSVLRGEDTLEVLLQRVRETFDADAVALLEREDERGPWTCVGSVGEGQPLARPEDGDVDMPVGDHMMLVLAGRVLPAADRRVLAAFAAQAARVLDRERLLGEAEQARDLAEGNRIRTALLAAVSHDLRTPLAAIKASVSSLRSADVEWSPQDEAELLRAIEEGADRLDNLVGNLLDMSRLNTGTVVPLIRDISLEEVVPKALGGVPEQSVRLAIAEALPLVAVDPGLLERAVANLVENAVKHSPPEKKVLVKASALADRVELRITDRGPGVPDAAKERIFEPFQRHGDAPRGAGVGLGLAVARGFAEAMGGTLDAEDTPGGGMTMVLTLPAAHSRANARAALPPQLGPGAPLVGARGRAGSTQGRGAGVPASVGPGSGRPRSVGKSQGRTQGEGA